MDKLETIKMLEHDWDGNEAKAFSPEFIEEVSEIVSGLTIRPEIFPTALGTIQLEYDNFRRDHMEIEIGKSVDAEVFIAMFDGEEYIEKIPADADSINSYVSRFYS